MLRTGYYCYYCSWPDFQPRYNELGLLIILFFKLVSLYYAVGGLSHSTKKQRKNILFI